MRNIFHYLLLSSFVAVTYNLAVAQEPPPPPTGDDWRVISTDRTMVSSDCIGSNETPECLADTIVACDKWSVPIRFADDGTFQDDPTCYLQPGVYAFASRLTSDERWPEEVVYYFYDIWIVDEQAAASFDTLKPNDRRIVAGDLAVDVRFRINLPTKTCVRENASNYSRPIPASVCPRTKIYDRFSSYADYVQPSTTYFMREVNGSWTVFSNYSAGFYGNKEDDQWRPDYWKRK